MLTYWTRGNCPSVDPVNGLASKKTLSEFCCCAVALKFDLFNLPSCYSISSAKLMMYKPSLLMYPAPITPFNGGAYAYPAAAIGSGYSGRYNLDLSFGSALGAASDSYTAAQQAISMGDLTALTLGQKGFSRGDSLRATQIYNFWNWDSIDSSSELGGSSYCLIPVLAEEGPENYAGCWVEYSLTSSAISVLSNHRGSVWMRACVPPANMITYGVQGNGGYRAAGVIYSAYIGGFAIKLQFSGGE
jgi:hypothetical protein